MLDEQLIIHIQMLALVNVKINNSSVCDMNSRFMQFQIEITDILQLLMMILWQQQQKSFFSVGVDLVGFFLYFWVCFWFCVSVYELPSLLTYRWFLFSLFLLSSSICGFFIFALLLILLLRWLQCMPYQTQYLFECTTAVC